MKSIPQVFLLAIETDLFQFWRYNHFYESTGFTTLEILGVLHDCSTEYNVVLLPIVSRSKRLACKNLLFFRQCLTSHIISLFKYPADDSRRFKICFQFFLFESDRQRLELKVYKYQVSYFVNTRKKEGKKERQKDSFVCFSMLLCKRRSECQYFQNYTRWKQKETMLLAILSQR